MKKRNNRFLAGTLAGLMMLTMLPVTALAAEESAGSEITTLTTEDGGAVSGISNNIVNVVSDGEDSQQAVDTGANNEENSGAEDVQAPADDSENSDVDTDENAAAPLDGESGGSGSSSEPAPVPAAEPFVAKIGNQTYETLDEAVAAVADDEAIEIVEDCELTVGTIEKTVVINGNGHTISIPEQNSDNHALKINASLTFNKANVVFTNDIDDVKQWSATMNSDGVLTLNEGSTCTIETHGIYATPNAVINVKGASKLTVQNTTYTAMMAEAFATLNIENGSEVVVDNADHQGNKPEADGITSFKINVTNATLNVRNCENQGLVNCELMLDKSQSEIRDNDMGITGWTGTDVLTMKNGSTLMIKDNAHSGIYMSGGKVDVQDGTTLTITGTGNSVDEEAVEGYYVGALAISTANPANATVTFADNATVNLVNNAVSAIRNRGTIDIGAGTVIKNNGSKTQYCFR